jgi:hypothetical protein
VIPEEVENVGVFGETEDDEMNQYEAEDEFVEDEDEA